MRQQLLLTLLLVTFLGCKESMNVPDIFISFDDLSGYVDSSVLSTKVAYSGTTSLMVSDYNLYGIAWKQKFEKLPPHKTSIIHIGFWANRMSTQATGKLVVAVNDSTGKNISWQAINIDKKELTQEKHWFQIQGDFDLDKFWSPTNVIVIYPYSTGSGELFIDDLSISFK